MENCLLWAASPFSVSSPFTRKGNSDDDEMTQMTENKKVIMVTVLQKLRWVNYGKMQTCSPRPLKYLAIWPLP